ncbi:MAG: alpha/beta fold hydrolase [Jiangellales bacterium]
MTRRPVTLIVVAVLAAIVAVLGVLVLTPLLDPTLDAQAQPSSSYEEAMARSADLLGADGDDVNPLCRSRVYDQGERSDVAVVLLHGFTNCPAQWDAIAAAYVDAGYSVVVPRLPGHGEQDRLSPALSTIGPDNLVDTGDLAVDIAAGLGEDVWVVGLSGGGTLAGWLASERDEISTAVLIAPLVAPKVLPELAVGPVARASRFIPDVSIWWDSDLKEQLETPPYAYPRFTLRSLGAFLAVGRATQHTEPRRETPLERLVVVTNENDAAVSNAGVYDVERQLEQLLRLDEGGVDRIDYVFADDLQLKHDVIDPQGENAERLDEIYPLLGPLLGLPGLAAP